MVTVSYHMAHRLRAVLLSEVLLQETVLRCSDGGHHELGAALGML